MQTFNFKAHPSNYRGDFLEHFRYFLECYFVSGFNYDDLPKIINEYKKTESIDNLEGSKREMNIILELNDWQYIEHFVKKHGLRVLPEEKLKNLVELISTKLP